jgi:cellobiose transport system permease protein
MNASANARLSKGKNAFGWRRRATPYIFVAPYFLIFLALSVFPIIFSVYVSFMDWNGFTAGTFVGLSNYAELFRDPRFFKSLGNTFLLMAMIIPPQVILGLFIALLLNTKNLPFRKGYRLLNILPYLTASIALGMIFSILFDSNFGSINTALKIIGIKSPPDWISREWPARWMVAMVTVWRYAGYTSVLFLAGITNISPDLYEAAEIDGASAAQRVVHIVLPLLRSVTVFVVLTTMIGCFQIFEEPFMIFKVMGKLIGGPNNSVLTGMWFFYDTSFGSTMRFGYGSAIAFGMLMAITMLTFVVNGFINPRRKDL